MEDNMLPLLDPQNDLEANLIMQPAGANPKFCEICYEEHAEENFVSNAGCGHTFCKQSYGDFLTYEITQSGSKGFFIKCPQQGCNQPVSEEFVRVVCDEETYKKFKQFKVDKEVMSSDLKKFCPNPKCENVIVEAPNKNTIQIKCPECKEDFCFQCLVKWHKNLTCD